MRIMTCIDGRDAMFLEASAEAGDAFSEHVAADAIGAFLDEAENGLNPLITPADPEESVLVITDVEGETEARLKKFLEGSDFSAEDVLASAVRHMVVGEIIEAEEELASKVDSYDPARAAFMDWLRSTEDPNTF